MAFSRLRTNKNGTRYISPRSPLNVISRIRLDQKRENPDGFSRGFPACFWNKTESLILSFESCATRANLVTFSSTHILG